MSLTDAERRAIVARRHPYGVACPTCEAAEADAATYTADEALTISARSL